jgi:hypothetical protein
MNDVEARAERLREFYSEFDRLFNSESVQELSKHGFLKRDIEELIETKITIEKMRLVFSCDPFSDIVALIQRFKDGGYTDEQAKLINDFVLKGVV